MNNNKNKILIIIVSIVLGLVLLIGGTYAIYTWAVQMDIDGEGHCFDVVYLKGKDIGSNEENKTLMVGKNYYDGLSTTVEVKLSDSCGIENGNGTLYLTTDTTTGSDLLSSNALKYQVIDGNTISSSGTINTTGKIEIANDINITKNDKAITVFVWIDGSYVTEDNYEEILASTYGGSISLEVESR